MTRLPTSMFLYHVVMVDHAARTEYPVTKAPVPLGDATKIKNVRVKRVTDAGLSLELRSVLIADDGGAS